MTDVELLRLRIDESGLKRSTIASMLGLTYQGFYNKCYNKSEFTSGEIMKLCKILKITKLTDRDRIFFARKCD